MDNSDVRDAGGGHYEIKRSREIPGRSASRLCSTWATAGK